MELLDILGKSVLSRGNSQCKGREAGVCLVWIGKSEEASVSVVEWPVGRGRGGKSEVTGPDHAGLPGLWQEGRGHG